MFSSAPVCHVREVFEEQLIGVRQVPGLPRRRQDRLLRRELLVEVGNVLVSFLKSNEMGTEWLQVATKDVIKLGAMKRVLTYKFLMKKAHSF